MYKFTVYFYDPTCPCVPGIDTNELWIGDKYIGEITSVQDVRTLDEIPEYKLEYVVLIVPHNTRLPIRNVNLYPEEMW